MNRIKYGRLKKFKKFVRRWVREHISPLTGDDIPTVEQWLETTIYPDYRKAELLEVARVLGDMIPTRKEGHFDNESFIKSENYVTFSDKPAQFDFFPKDPDDCPVVRTYNTQCFKHARGINSRTDVFKVYSGPYFKAMEKDLFKLHYFIKKVPVVDRPSYMSRILRGWNHYFETDYTSFEAGFCPEFMKSCECVLYRHYLKNFPQAYLVIEDALTGVNKCLYKDFVIHIGGTRMSGDMCTSLGNGFSNLMMFLFAAEESGAKCNGIFEGDDGLCGTDKPIDATVFSDLGFDIKIVEHHNYMTASFCGMVVSSEGTLMKDARKVLVCFGWSHSLLIRGSTKTLRGLLRAKALSLLYEAPRCPILTTLALHYIKLTEGVTPRYGTDWRSQTVLAESNVSWNRIQSEVAKGVSNRIRYDYAKHFGISVSTQLQVEDEIRASGFQGIDGPAVQSLFPSDSPLREYDSRFVSALDWDDCRMFEVDV